MAKVTQLLFGEYVFKTTKEEGPLRKGWEVCFEMFQVGRKRMVVYQYVIKEDNHQFLDKWPGKVIRSGLKCWGGVTQPKGQNLELIMFVMYAEHDFMNVGIIDSKLMKTLTEVEFRKPWSASEFIDWLIYRWYGEMIFNGDNVQSSV